MMRSFITFLVASMFPLVSFAQQADAPSLKQLELGSNGEGYAVILNTDGHEHYCTARETRDAIELGPCKPLRLVTPLTNEQNTVDRQSIQTMSPAKRAVVDLFELNRCSLSYNDLKQALGRLGSLQRQTIGQAVAEMSERGEIADDAARERAVLRVGDRCG